MALIDLLRKARAGRSSILHQYLLNSGKASLAIHAFVEGRHDRIFYGGFLRGLVGGRVFTYVCGNKRSVYYAYKQVQPRLRADDYALYFVDKDLDDLIPVEFPSANEIYVTDHYSIENYLVTFTVVESVWVDHYRQEPTGEGFERLKECFTESREAFHVIARQIAAWTIHHRRRGAKPQTNNIDLRRLVEISSDLALSALAKDDETIQILDDCCQVETTGDWDKERDDLRDLVDSQPAKAVTKGKFELGFLVAFLRAVRNLLEQVAEAEGSHLATSFVITEGNAMEILGSRVEVPTSLREFLERALGPLKRKL